MRIFTALELTPQARLVPAYYSLRLREADVFLPSMFEASHNMHITLNFMGELEEEKVDRVCEAVRSVASERTYFAYFFDGPADFAEAKVVMLPVRENAELNGLQSDLAGRLDGIKHDSVVWPDSYVPHVTIARVKSMDDVLAARFVLAGDRSPESAGLNTIVANLATNVCVMESYKDDFGGVKYRTLRRYPLLTGKRSHYHES